MIEQLARLGFASKAFIYATVGLLAGAAALNEGGTVTDTRGALRVILSHPFGNTVLFVLAVGLCGYSLWRVLDAFLDPDRRGTSAKGLTVRIGGGAAGARLRRRSASKRSGSRAACEPRAAATPRSGCGRRR